MESKCPNCQVRPADTDVEYDEVLSARFQSVASGRGGWYARSFKGISTYGRARLCARCAADYRRVVWLRTTGRRAANYGFAALLLGAVLFGILAAAEPRWSNGIAGLILATPMVLALVVMLAGTALYALAMVRRRSATRFIGRVSTFTPSASDVPTYSAATSAPPEGPDSALIPPRTNWTRLSPEERAAARARRRRRRRLTWIGLSIAWVAAVIAAVLIYTNTIGHFSLISQGVQHFTDPLTTDAQAWPNHDACTFHDGAYHIAPTNNGEGVTCFSPQVAIPTSTSMSPPRWSPARPTPATASRSAPPTVGMSTNSRSPPTAWRAWMSSFVPG